MPYNSLMQFWGFYLACPVILWLLFRVIFTPFPSYSQHDKKSLSVNNRADAIPAIVVHDEWFKATRASLRQLTQGMNTLLSGYNQYSRNGLPFIVHEPSFQQEILLPPEHIKWFSSQPDSKMSSRTIREERHAVGYLHVGVEFDSTLFFLERIIRDSLTRNLDTIQGPMREEIVRQFDQMFEADGVASDEWRTIKVYDSFQKLILPVMTRVFFGLPLSRDVSFLKSFERYMLAMGVGTIVIGELPKFLKSLFVPLFNLPLRYYRSTTLHKLVPEVEQQLSESDGRSQEVSFVSQCARVSAKSANLSSAKDPQILAEWLMLAGFAAMSSTVIQISNSLLDILHCDSELGLVQALRDEAESVLKTEDDWSTSTAFHKLVLYDSAIRESLRCHPILIKGLTKEVIDPDGLKLPNGTLLPRGSWVGVPVVGIHRDERFYPKSSTYDPYRFLKLKLDVEKNASGDQRTTTSEYDAARPGVEYLGFGYGRHACPGRWFAVLMMKTLLAHLLLRYDVEATTPPPKTSVIGDAALPPLSSSIRVRRRNVVPSQH
ncbi:cytochrome P450 [Stachybotrys elegans]|uniref:Cytochrome P450 n=1 Tax=Stachybotrys elegans TaxID=80388 RepID=A0A8K0SYV0_9HYPO|nr:cytochrome P450 [Stachybotrys elegans]